MRKHLLTLGFVFALVVLMTPDVPAQVAWKSKTSVTVLKTYPEKSKDAPIEILGEEPKDREYEPVCLITASGGHTIFNAKKGSDLIKKMQVDARKCGADALVIRTSEDQTWKPLRGGIDQGAKSQAMAIRYVDPPVDPSDPGGRD